MAELTEEEKRQILETVDFVQKLTEKISAASKPDSSKKHGLRVFLESAGGAAFVTVVLGGLLGNWVASTIADKQKDREFQQAWLQARGNQAMVAYKEYLDSEKAIVTEAYDTIGNLVSASDNLISITAAEFDLERYQGAERTRVSNQKVEVRNDFNARLGKWDSRNGTLGFLMDFYHPRSAGVNIAWNVASQATTAYGVCANRWYVGVVFPPADAKPKTPPRPESTTCDKEKKEVLAKMESLGKIMNSARRYAWEGWESPETLKAALDAKPGAASIGRPTDSTP